MIVKVYFIANLQDINNIIREALPYVKRFYIHEIKIVAIYNAHINYL